MMRRLANRLTTWSALVCGPTLLMYAGPDLDAAVYGPVVAPFVVTSREWIDGRTLIVSGWMTKRRECHLDELFAVQVPPRAVARLANIEFLERHDRALVSRPAIEQSWGPWQITVTSAPASTIYIRTRHRCHALWDVTAQHEIYSPPESAQ